MKIKKADIILAIIIIILGTAVSIYLFLNKTPIKDGQVVVHANHKIYGTYPLDKDDTITIKADGHENKIVIKDGSVKMVDADCPNKDCIKQGSIHDESKSIICLPNKVVVEIKNGGSDFDSVSR